MNLYTINTGHFKLDGGAMFGVVPKSIWNKLNAADENNMCSWAMRCLLIEDEGRLILIDNGMGDKQDAKFFGHYYLHGNDTLDRSLAAYGFLRDDITDVFLTHLHFDHCGGSVIREHDKLLPAFKNATYWSNEQHWAHAIQANEREKASFLKENILPIQESGQLKWIPSPLSGSSGEELTAPQVQLSSGFLTNSLSAIFVNGHTQAMMLPEISYKDNKIIFMADLLPSIAHLPMPYIMSYDIQPLITLSEKKLILNRAMEKKHIFFFEHDPIHECCTLEMTDKGIRAGKVFSLKDI
ncbi:MAG: MBL fold metallo-hydrolase [Chitinophagaceae bacterium]|nr:MBL fold metallo-hydrolase [Chitinophagaceae bacterium]